MTPVPADRVVELLERLVENSEPRLAVGSRQAAQMLGIGLDHLAQLRAAGVIATVPHLSTPKKLIFAVRELERVAELGVTRQRPLRSAS